MVATTDEEILELFERIKKGDTIRYYAEGIEEKQEVTTCHTYEKGNKEVGFSPIGRNRYLVSEPWKNTVILKRETRPRLSFKEHNGEKEEWKVTELEIVDSADE